VSGFRSGPTDIVSTQLLSAILNTTLASNGGLTGIHSLVPGSPAIDSVTDGTCRRRPETSGGFQDPRMVMVTVVSRVTAARSNGDRLLGGKGGTYRPTGLTASSVASNVG
jgi:hypothetical protein